MTLDQLYKRHVGRAKILHAQGRISPDALGAIISGRGELRESFGRVEMFEREKSNWRFWHGAYDEYIREACQ